MASSALSVASPCPVGEVLRAPTDGELYREEDHDGAASVSFVRCTTLPWFSHSAGDILRLLQHARFTSTRGVLNQHWYGRRRATDHALCLHSGFFAFQVCLSPEHLSPRVTKRS